MSEPEVLHEWTDVDRWRLRNLGMGDVRLEGLAPRPGASWVQVNPDPIDGMLVRELARLAAQVREMEEMYEREEWER